MKTSINLTIAILIFTGCLSLKKNSIVKSSDFKPLNQNFSPNNILVAKQEITNKQFRKFILGSGKTEFQYDSLQWNRISRHINEPMERNYHWHPAFNNYPVVNITYTAAKAYCEWLTKEYLEKTGDNNTIFRLPTENEFKLLMNDRKFKITSDFQEDYNCDFPGNLLYKSKDTDKVNYAVDQAALTSPVTKFEVNDINCILGNVSEICANKIILGGNWTNFPSEIYGQKEYTLPDPRVGFRVVMEKK